MPLLLSFGFYTLPSRQCRLDHTCCLNCFKAVPIETQAPLEVRPDSLSLGLLGTTPLGKGWMHEEKRQGEWFCPILHIQRLKLREGHTPSPYAVGHRCVWTSRDC